MTNRRAIAAAQTVPERGAVEANVEQHLRLARQAAEAGARILVFPELSLTGYELELAGALAFTESDPRLEPLAEAARALGVTLIAGAPLRTRARLHIAAFVLAPDGSRAIYTKQHLGAFPASAGQGAAVPPAEATVFEPGELDPLVRCGSGAAALAICADVGRPSHARRAAERGASAYLAGMFVIPSELEAETAKLRGYAARHALAVAMANYGGPTGGLGAAGGSAIWSPRGELVAALGPRGAGVALAIEEHAGWRGEAIALEETRPA
jgi:predicted amidohydrolase